MHSPGELSPPREDNPLLCIQLGDHHPLERIITCHAITWGIISPQIFYPFSWGIINPQRGLSPLTHYPQGESAPSEGNYLLCIPLENYYPRHLSLPRRELSSFMHSLGKLLPHLQGYQHSQSTLGIFHSQKKCTVQVIRMLYPFRRNRKQTAVTNIIHRQCMV